MSRESELLSTIFQSNDEEIYEFIDKLNCYGIASDLDLSFSRVIYNEASNELLQHIKDKGYQGDLALVGRYIDYVGNAYAVYDVSIYNMSQAIEWLKKINYPVQLEYSEFLKTQ